MKKLSVIAALTASIFALTGCGGGSGGGNSSNPSTYSVAGTVAGLNGSQVVLQNNGSDTLTVSSSGSFKFPVSISANGSYAVTVLTQPVGQTCTVSNGTGSGVVADISNVQVNCAAITYAIGGTVSGLSNGSQLVLQNNSANQTAITANGNFTFSTPVAYNGSYAVTVLTQPTGQTCTVNNGTGSGVTGNITSIAISCHENTYTIGGNVSGLNNGQQVTLLNNSADPLTLVGNGTFAFSTPVSYSGSYSVVVGTQPTGQTCSVTNGTGANVSSNINNVSVACTTNTYSVGGTVSGLKNGLQVTLLNNGGDSLTATGNASFSFGTQVAYGSAYSITIGTQPVGQICNVTNGSGMVASSISNVQISCENRLGKFAYVANFNSATISQFRIDNSTGNLTPLSIATMVSGDHPSSVSPHPNGKFLYAANGSSTPYALYAYSIHPITGLLSEVGHYSLGSGNGSYSLTVDPLGRYVYVAVASGGVVSYAIDQTTGGLTAIGTYQTSAGGFPTAVTTDPTGKFVYVLNQTTNNISAYSVNQSSGELIAVGTYATGGGGYGIVVDPTGKFLYSSSVRNGKNIQAYSINASTGALTFSAGYGNNTSTDNLAFNPAGNILYNVRASDVVAYTLNSTSGALTLLGTYVTGGSGGNAIAIDPRNKFAYVPNKGWDYVGDVSVMVINQTTGALTASTPVASGRYNVSIGISVEQ